MDPQRLVPVAAAFSRDAGWMAAALNGASLLALPLFAGLPALGGLTTGGIVLAGASFGLGGAFAGLFAFLGYLHYAWRAEAGTAAEAGGDPAPAARRARAAHVLGILAGTLSFLAFMSGWIFAGDAAIRAGGWNW